MTSAQILSLSALPFFFCACASPYAGGRASYSHFLSDQQLEGRQFEAAPPPGSAEDKTDFERLRQSERGRKPEVCAAARASAKGRFDDIFSRSGVFASPVTGEIRRFFDVVRADTRAAVRVQWRRNGRKRPFLRDQSLNPCPGRRPGGPSFPSAGAACARVYALILGELVPDRAEEFLETADEMSDAELSAGHSHPSDIEAGKRFGNLTFHEMMGNPRFRQALDRIRQLQNAGKGENR